MILTKCQNFPKVIVDNGKKAKKSVNHIDKYS